MIDFLTFFALAHSVNFRTHAGMQGNYSKTQELFLVNQQPGPYFLGASFIQSNDKQDAQHSEGLQGQISGNAGDAG